MQNEGGKTGQKTLTFLCPKSIQLCLASEIINAAQNPLTIGLLSSIGVVMIPQDFAGLFHEFKLGIRTNFRLVFHPAP